MVLPTAKPRIVRVFVGLSCVVCAAASVAADLPDTKGLFAIGDHARRESALVAALLPLDAKATQSWVKAIDEAPACAARAEDRLVAVERWAQLDPTAAEHYVSAFQSTLRSQVALEAALLRGWTRADPDAAWNWSQQQPAQNELDLQRVVIEAMAETTPDKGFERLQTEVTHASANSLQSGPTSERAFGFFRALIELGDYETGRRLIEKFPTGELCNQMLFFFADRTAGFALADTAAWARSRKGDDVFYPLAAVAAQECRHDAEAGLTWTLATEDDTLRAKLVRVAAGEIVSHDPTLARAEHILDRLKTSVDRQGAYGAFAATEDLVHAAPAKVLEWAAQIEDETDRRQSLIHGYGAWFEFDRPAAEAHLQNAKISAADRASVKNYLLGGEKTP